MKPGDYIMEAAKKQAEGEVAPALDADDALDAFRMPSQLVVADELDLGDAKDAKEGDDAEVLASVAGEDLHLGVLPVDGLLGVEHLDVAGVLGVEVTEESPVLVVGVGEPHLELVGHARVQLEVGELHF